MLNQGSNKEQEGDVCSLMHLLRSSISCRGCLWCRGSDPKATTPFSIGCQKLGYQDVGGKLDDIAVSHA